MPPEVDFFISHTGRDRAWAEWVAWHLVDAGYTVELDVWDWAPGDDFIGRMDGALARSAQMIALLSAAYFDEARFTTPEWRARMADRSASRQDTIIPLRVENVADLPPLWKPLIHADLFGLSEVQARRALLAAVGGASRPTTAPVFPGGWIGPVLAGPRVPGSLPGVWNVPARSTAFSGRDDLLLQLRESLTTATRAALYALHGIGGVGKTQLAIEYAHRFAGAYDLVWWVSAEQPGLIAEQLAALATTAGLVAASSSVGAAQQALHTFLRGHGGWLIVFDNAPTAAQVASTLPQGPGHVLLTSRDPHWSGTAVSVAVDVFTRAESIAYLTERLPGAHPAELGRLATSLGDLPLALAQAAGVMARSSMPIREYLDAFTTTQQRLLHQDGRPVPDSPPLAASVQLSTDKLDQAEPEAAQLARLCALLGPEPIPLDLFSPGPELSEPLDTVMHDRLRLREAIGQMVQLGLAQSGSDTVTMHRLTQALIRASLTPDQHQATRQAADALLVEANPNDAGNPVTWPRWAQLLPHILAADPTTTTNQDVGWLFMDAVWYLIYRGDYPTALPLVQSLHQHWTDQLGPEHELAIAMAVSLAAALQSTGQYEQARELDEAALQRHRRVHGDDHPNTLNSAHNLAVDLTELGEHEQARQLDEDTLTRYRRILGDDHPDTLGSAHNLAGDLRALGQHEQARQLDEDTLTRSRRILGDDHPDTLGSAHNLASDLQALGHHEQARQLDEDTLTRRRRVLGDNHPDTLQSAHNLALDLTALGQHEQARQLEEWIAAQRQRPQVHRVSSRRPE